MTDETVTKEPLSITFDILECQKCHFRHVVCTNNPYIAACCISEDESEGDEITRAINSRMVLVGELVLTEAELLARFDDEQKMEGELK